MCLSQIPIASHRKYSNTISNCVLARFRSLLIENILGHFHFVSEPNSNRISLKIFSDNFNMCLSQIPTATHRKNSNSFKVCLSQTPIASQRKISKTIPNCVLAKFQSHLIKNILRQVQIVSETNSIRISSKIFSDNSKLCLSQIPIASHRKHSKTISKCVLAKFQSHLIENVLRKFQIVS